MQVNSVSALNNAISCQPIRKMNIENYAMPFKSSKYNEQGDVAELTSKPTLEQKYDFACRVAAFYKNQFEALKNQGNVQI